MIKFKNLIFPASAALVVVAGLTSGTRAQTPPADLPPDVIEFVGRRSSCLEWSIKAFDPERKAQLDSIMSIMRSLKCDEITHDENALRQKYAASAWILDALKATWTKIVKRLPVRIFVPQDSSR